MKIYDVTFFSKGRKHYTCRFGQLSVMTDHIENARVAAIIEFHDKELVHRAWYPDRGFCDANGTPMLRDFLK